MSMALLVTIGSVLNRPLNRPRLNLPNTLPTHAHNLANLL